MSHFYCPSVLQPPLKRIGDCKKSKLWWILENLVRESVSSNLIKWEVPFDKESDDVITIALPFEYVEDSSGGLIVSCSKRINKDSMEEIHARGFRLVIVSLFINKHEKMITKPINLLCCLSIWAGGLRLLD